MYKKIIVTIALLVVLLPCLAVPVSAGSSDTVFWANMSQGVQANTGLNNSQPQLIVARIINVVLGFLGILAVSLILFGGFKWMTAAGNESKVEEAKKLLVAGVIGLIIITAAFALAAYVISAAYSATK